MKTVQKEARTVGPRSNTEALSCQKRSHASKFTTILKPATVRTKKAELTNGVGPVGDRFENVTGKKTSQGSEFKTPPVGSGSENATRKTSQASEFKTPLMSPIKTARVMGLKARFGTTILKAQHALFNYANMTPALVPVPAPASAPASCIIVPQTRISSIEEQRQAAREALEKVQPEFGFNENLDSMRDFEQLIRGGNK